MKSFEILRIALSSALVAAILFGPVSSAPAGDNKIIAKCSLTETSIVKTVGYESKARELQWQVSKNAKTFPWVQSMLASNPAAALPETETASPGESQAAGKMVLATMQFIEEDKRPFSIGSVALGDIALAVYPAKDTPVRYAIEKKNGKILITRKSAPQRPLVRLTYTVDN